MKNKEIRALFNSIMNEIGNPPMFLLSKQEWKNKYGDDLNKKGILGISFSPDGYIGDMWINPRGDRISETIWHEIIHIMFPCCSEEWVISSAEYMNTKNKGFGKNDLTVTWFIFETIKDVSSVLNERLKEKDE